jgi:hypothetical protein
MAERRKLSQQTAPVAALHEVKEEVWRGWLRKQSGAKQSGKSRLTLGSVLRKWDQRYFVVRRPPGQGIASIEWYRSEDTSCQPQHSFVLAGGALRPTDGDSCVLLLPPMEPGGKSHRVTLKHEGEFTTFVTALSTCGVSVQLAPEHTVLSTNGHVPCAAVPSIDEAGQAMDVAAKVPEVAEVARHTRPASTVDAVVDDQTIVQRAQQFVRAVAASVHRLQDPLAQGHSTHELHSVLGRLINASADAGVVVRSRQITLTAETGLRLGLRLESFPSAADVIVQGGSFYPQVSTPL